MPEEIKLSDYELSKAQTALASILNVAAMIKAPPQANADGIVGVTAELKAAKPVPAILTEDQLNQLTAAVRKAALEGRHTVLTGILGGIRDVVAKATGLGALFG